MRHRYNTSAIVIARTPLAEASALLYALTPEFGLIKARAQGVRKAGAKLAPSVQTLTEHDAILVKGKEGWRLSGAVLTEDWFHALSSEKRACAGRIARLLLRLVHGESQGTELFGIYRAFLEALTTQTAEEVEHSELLVALHVLRELGLDAGVMPVSSHYDADTMSFAMQHRKELVTRINHGISASGL